MKVEEAKKGEISVQWGKRADGTSSKIRKMVEEKKDEIFSYEDLISLTGKKRRNLIAIVQHLLKRGDIGRVYVNDQPYIGNVETVGKLLKEGAKQK
jgi:hypothetical protein